MTRVRSLTLAILISAMLIVPWNVFGCGPFFLDAVFTYQDHPDYPLKPFANGDLGIVQTTYKRLYLVTAYRYLSQRPLSNDESQSMLDIWHKQLSGGYFQEETAPNTKKRPVDQWVETRDSVLGSGDQKRKELGTDQQYAGGTSFDSYLNCPNDAFRTAVATYTNRKTRYSPAELKDWVQGQDAVFSNCSQKGLMPADAPSSASALFKADRAYQITAAKFYAGDFDQARAGFEAISKDKASPWHELARYLMTRTLIRKATLVTAPDKRFDATLLAQAGSELRALMADKNAPTLHAPSRRMLGFVEARLHPQQRITELAKALSGPTPDPDFGQDTLDYVSLLYNTFSSAPTYYDRAESAEANQKRNLELIEQWRKTSAAALGTLSAESDLTNWILNFEGSDPQSREHAVARWRETKSLAWLASALSKTNGKDPEANELLAAAARVTVDSPAFNTVTYHRVRLLREKSKPAEARSVLEKALTPRKPVTPPSAVNAFLNQRMQVATSFDDFLKYTPRLPVNLDWDEEESPYCYDQARCREMVYGDNFAPVRYQQKWDSKSQKAINVPLEQLFDNEAAHIFNTHLPLSLLVDAASGERLPANLREDVALAAWSRAVMLGDADAAKRLSQPLAKLAPQLAPYLTAYDSETTADGRKFAGVFAMLHFPGLRPYVNAGAERETPLSDIDNLRDNWWCPDVGARVGVPNFVNDARREGKPPADEALAPLAFVTAAQQQTGAAEWQKLSQSGTGPNYLSAEVVRFAKAHPDDARVPEALHLAVRSTRYGCTDDKTSAFSKQAFTLLHQRYPDSEWAKKTKYWF